MKEILLKIDIALLGTLVGVLATSFSMLNALYSTRRQAILDHQDILRSLAVVSQRLDHIEERLDRNDNFIAANSGFTGKQHE